MDEFTQIVRDAGKVGGVSDTLFLEYAKREKTRFKAVLDSGEFIGIKLPRGTVVRGGDHLRSELGRVVLVSAAREPVSTAYSDNPELLARIAYHLGNRHVWVQVGPAWVRYLTDHVLDDMVRGLGCEPVNENAPFEPEGGAYHVHSHEH